MVSNKHSMYKKLTKESLLEAVTGLRDNNRNPDKQLRIPLGSKGVRMFDFAIDIARFKIKARFWRTFSSEKHCYDEYTFYNKGNLYKIRHYRKHQTRDTLWYYEVWYGTKKVLYCTDLASALRQVPIPPSYQERKRH